MNKNLCEFEYYAQNHYCFKYHYYVKKILTVMPKKFYYYAQNHHYLKYACIIHSDNFYT